PQPADGHLPPHPELPLRVPGHPGRPRLHLLRPQGRRDEERGGAAECELPREVLPPHGLGGGHVRREPERPHPRAVGPGRPCPPPGGRGPRSPRPAPAPESAMLLHPPAGREAVARLRERLLRGRGGRRLGALLLAGALFLLLPVVQFKDPLSTVILDREGELLG